MFDSDFKLFNLNLEMRYFFLGLINFSYIFLDFPLKLLFLILDTFNFLIFETIFHFIDTISSDLFFFFELLKFLFNILKFLCEISSLDIQGHVRQFIFNFLPPVILAIKFFLFISELIHFSLILFIDLSFRIKLSSLFFHFGFNLLKFCKLWKDQGTGIHVASRKGALFIDISIIGDTFARKISFGVVSYFLSNLWGRADHETGKYILD